MAVNQIGRQSSEYLKTGKAKMYAQLIDEQGNPLSPVKDVGNLESASMGSESETNSVATGEDDSPAPARTFSRISAATLTVVCRNHNPIVNIWNMQSDPEDYVQAEVANGTYEDELTYKAGDLIMLPHNNITAITTITDGADANDLAAANYRVDTNAGVILIDSLPDGVDELVGVKVAYTAGATTVEQYTNGLSRNGVLCRIWLRETADGPRGTYLIYRGRVNKDGENGIVADGLDPMTASFSIAIESDPDQPAPGLFRYRKHTGSL